MKCVCCDGEIGLEEDQVAFLVKGIRFGVHFWHLFELVGENGVGQIETLAASQKRREAAARGPVRVVKRGDGGGNE